jgi:GAF domain-containing protein/nitrogen-specific signal transduction histidine kinase
MSASPDNTQPVFDLITRRAQELCHSTAAGIFERDGDLIRVRSVYGNNDPAGLAEFLKAFPMPMTRGLISCRAILDGRTVHIRDTSADPELLSVVRGLGVKAMVSIPLMRDGVAVGAFSLNTQDAAGFTDNQVALLQTFAEQAAIAIGSAETYRALQERTTDVQQALEYQTATSDVLKVISGSDFELDPVFQAVITTAARLCLADQATIYRYEDGEYGWAAGTSMPAEYERIERGFRTGPGRGSLVGRVALEKGTVQILDAWNDPLYALKDDARVGGVRTILGVPLMRDGEPIGVIGVGRWRVEPFTERQIDLVRTFADQAVIAIENTRLINETREALEQQTATAEVLQVINSSPGDLAPVFDAMLENAMRLCDIAFGLLYTRDGEYFRAVAARGLPPALAEYSRRPFKVPPGSTFDELVAGVSVVQIPDIATDDRPASDARRALIELGGGRTGLAIALRKDDEFLGAFWFYRQEVRPFTDKQIALLQNFAAQAVIAMENARLLTEQREALEQQTATTEVLQVINSSPGVLAPVFEAILEKAHTLCGATLGSLQIADGQHIGSVAERGVPDDLAKLLRGPTPLNDRLPYWPLLGGERFVQIADFLMHSAQYRNSISLKVIELGAIRTLLWVPLRKGRTFLGQIVAGRQEVCPFSDREIRLLETFATQAVIAMENARLITETREALEQQTATAEVLQVINSSPSNLAPVFDAVLDKALRLCDANFGQLTTFDGVGFRAAAWQGFPPASERPVATPPTPGMALYRLIHGEEVIHVPDITADEVYRSGNPTRRRLADEFGGRTAIWVALKKDTALLGAFVIYRTEVRPFSHKQIALLQNFAAQAVIAMENARLLDEIRQRQEELRITFENMGDGVAMFDETPRLAAWNGKFQELLDVPDAILAKRLTYGEYIRYLTERGEYGPDAETEIQLRHFQERMRAHYSFERTRPDGRVIEVRHNPVPDGGFVLIYADITLRKRNEEEIRAARDAAEEASRTIEAAYRDLKAAQANLIQAEKMASLGQLTAGIAHEIKNPLNFVNNFATLSVDLLDELKETAAPGFAMLDEARRTEIDDLTRTLSGNLEKINEHGKRADGIVRSMLEHSRGSSGERRSVDLNALVDEALNLAYHGVRARDQGFNITLQRDFDEGIAPITLVPQDITRVLLNLFSNGFYAARRRQSMEVMPGFEPTLGVATRELGDAVEIRVRDNGIGIPEEVRDKLFQPFFTTKPTGEGTGLGLSISYDIVTQQHGGSITVDSKVGEYSEFAIRLPRNP